jgi:hypothetical protein
MKLPTTTSLAQWRDITSADRHNIFELLNMGWSALTGTIATEPRPERCTLLL